MQKITSKKPNQKPEAVSYLVFLFIDLLPVAAFTVEGQHLLNPLFFRLVCLSLCYLLHQFPREQRLL